MTGEEEEEKCVHVCVCEEQNEWTPVLCQASVYLPVCCAVSCMFFMAGWMRLSVQQAKKLCIHLLPTFVYVFIYFLLVVTSVGKETAEWRQ